MTICKLERYFIIHLPLSKHREPKDGYPGWFVTLDIKEVEERKRIRLLNMKFSNEKCLCKNCNPNTSTLDLNSTATFGGNNTDEIPGFF